MYGCPFGRVEFVRCHGLGVEAVEGEVEETGLGVLRGCVGEVRVV